MVSNADIASKKRDRFIRFPPDFWCIVALRFGKRQSKSIPFAIDPMAAPRYLFPLDRPTLRNLPGLVGAADRALGEEVHEQ
jgi:hypothetical protein